MRIRYAAACLAACAALFCANPLAFLRGLSDPDSPVRRLLRRK